MRAAGTVLVFVSLALGCGSPGTPDVASPPAPTDGTPPAKAPTKTQTPEKLSVAPSFSLPAHDGSTVALADLLKTGPAVLVFYRGHW